MTVSLIMFLSLFIAPLGFFLNKNYKDKSFVTLLIIPSVWVSLELLRSIIFGGFPWLIAGYSQEGTIFNMIYPIAGSYFVSFLICIISISIALFFKSKLCKSNFKNISVLIIFFNLLYFYNPVWSINKKDPLKISILQPNINPGIKYDDTQIDFIKRETVYLSSDFAKYNVLSLETNFNKNVILEYTEHKINSENIDLSFKENFAWVYNNIVYKGPTNQFFADRLEIDLLTKNSKVFMYDNKKIRVIGE